MPSCDLVLGVRQLFTAAPEELKSKISVNAPIPFPPPAPFQAAPRVDSSDHAPYKANCCGQQGWPKAEQSFARSADPLRDQILANFRDRKIARFSDITPAKPQAPPPKV
jgi:hypothetical protein